MMIGSFLQLLRNFYTMALSGRLPSRRAIAAVVKLCGRRIERRWPFFPKAEGKSLNLGFEDLLEFQYARSSDFTALVVGAFDGVTNDPVGRFIRRNKCRAIFVEPQPGPFRRLSESMNGVKNVVLLNVAVDERSGTREMFCISPGAAELPAWTEQLASFQKDHILKHERKAHGLSRHIGTLQVRSISFTDLLTSCGLRSLSLLQIDAEGMDGQLLSWFPFDRIKPGMLHYETAHMAPDEHRAVRARLTALGYSVFLSDCPTDDMAVLY